KNPFCCLPLVFFSKLPLLPLLLPLSRGCQAEPSNIRTLKASKVVIFGSKILAYRLSLECVDRSSSTVRSWLEKIYW
ncbi:unnamed protein product, partial [Musa hybrid cultivar]